MKNSLISQILRTLMFKKNINTSELARNISIPQQTLQSIVAGQCNNPRKKTLKPIADFFNISLDQLMGNIPIPESIENIKIQTSIKKANQVPIFSKNEIEDFLEKPDQVNPNEYIFTNQKITNKTFAMLLSDSSMEPYFPKGSLLIIDPEKKIKNRCFVLVKIDETDLIIFRQLFIDDNKYYLKPMNPDFNKYSIKVLKEKDKIVGPLIEFRHFYAD